MNSNLVITFAPTGPIATTKDNLLFALRQFPREAVWQAIVIGRPHFEPSAVTLVLGGNARTGMEDTLYLRRGALAPNNESLVSRLAVAATILEKKITTVKDGEKEFVLGGDPR